MTFHPRHALLPSLIIALLNGCNASSTSETSSTDINTDSSTSVSLTGKVADGYLSGAKVCLDTNTNGLCDSEEPYATTDDAGAYSLDVSAADASAYPLVVEVPETAIDADTNAPVGQAYTLSAPAGKHQFISPLSTLVHAEMRLSNADQTTAENTIKNSLGLAVDLYDDYMTQTSNSDYTKAHDAAKTLVRSMQANAKVLGIDKPDLATQTVLAALAHKAVAGQNAAGAIDPTKVVGVADKATLLASIAVQKTTAAEATIPVEITFDLVNGTTPVRCGDTITLTNVVYNHDAAPFKSTGIEQNTSGKIVDSRFYIANVMLTDDQGTATPLILDTTADNYQGNGVALLSFGKGDGSCIPTNKKDNSPAGPVGSGSDANKMTITGKVKPGNYTGMMATLGVPVYAADLKTKLNHINPTPGDASGPLFDQPSMQWSWQLGRKFTKIEFQTNILNFSKGTSSLSKWNVHLGSTACSGDPTVTGNETTCLHPNRVPLVFSSFDPDSQKIALDLATLFGKSDMEFEGGISGGCMSSHASKTEGQYDPECPAIFDQLGLDLATGKAIKDQQVFKVVSK